VGCAFSCWESVHSGDNSSPLTSIYLILGHDNRKVEVCVDDFADINMFLLEHDNGSYICTVYKVDVRNVVLRKCFLLFYFQYP